MMQDKKIEKIKQILWLVGRSLFGIALGER
jgi:hypothetical protein